MDNVAIVSNSRRDRLKQATLECHRRLEQAVDAHGYFVDRPSYARWLQRSLEFHRAAFAALCPSTVRLCLGPRAIAERLALFERDIQDLGASVPDPGAAMVAAKRDGAETFGVLYVTEGATLGARLLVLRARRLGLDETFGARALTRQAHDLQSWKSFVQALEDFQGSSDQETRLVRSSQRTFELAASHFGSPP
jgi:heme oxygenase